MKKESTKQRSERILNQLRTKYPGKDIFDLDERGQHFVCEIEPTKNHSKYDRAVEVILSSKPHKHLKTTQHYTILSGTLELHIGKEIVILHSRDTYTISPDIIHWAVSNDECWVEIYSKPGWTKKDHISVKISLRSN